jgi:ubiquinone/menaquinone biosynthesis C-methylase UbiE
LQSQPDSHGSSNVFGGRLKRFLRVQFGKPAGVWGHLVGRIMVRTPSNMERIRWTLSTLNAQPADRVLEIGFGPGIAIELLSQIVTGGRIVGLDHSDVMVAQARKRNADAIRTGRVDLRLGSVSNLPDFGEPFDKIFTINSIHFWQEPVDCLKALRAALRPGGLIVVTIQPRSRGATEATTTVIGEELTANLARAGFTRCRLEIRHTKPVATACAIGVA